MITLILSTTLMGCAGGGVPWVTPEPSDPGAQAVAVARTALVADLLMAEFASPLMGDVEGGSCPEIRRVRDGDETTWELAYGEGCVPESGLLDVELAGTVALKAEEDVASVGFDGFAIDGLDLGGAGLGQIDDRGDGELQAALDLELGTDDGDFVLVRTLDLRMEQLGVTLAGSAGLGVGGSETTLVVDGVGVYYDDVADGCAMPSSGAITLGGATDGTLSFSATAASEGLVTVETSGSVEEVRYCAIETLF